MWYSTLHAHGSCLAFSSERQVFKTVITHWWFFSRKVFETENRCFKLMVLVFVFREKNPVKAQLNGGIGNLTVFGNGFRPRLVFVGLLSP